MDEKLIYAQDVFLSKINQICHKFGLNNIMAQLYAILYLSNRPMSLDEMVARLKISKGSVSVNMRALERYGAARKIWVKGSRKDYYEAEMNINKVIIDRVKSMMQGRLNELDDMVTSSSLILDSFNSTDDNGNKDMEIFRQRLNELKELHQQARYLFQMLNSDILNNLVEKRMKVNV